MLGMDAEARGSPGMMGAGWAVQSPAAEHSRIHMCLAAAAQHPGMILTDRRKQSLLAPRQSHAAASSMIVVVNTHQDALFLADQYCQ